MSPCRSRRRRMPMIDQDKSVPDDFIVMARSGLITGEKRERLYMVFDSTIDAVLEELEEED